MSEDKKIKKAHTVIMENRAVANLSGVEDVDSFDEKKVVLYTTHGMMTINGTELHISNLSVESGDLTLEGKISSIIYSDNENLKNASIFTRIFK
ncbi:MAG: sporulation protein YabP [Ruminococcaceae bacterium]|nr:sporulation protein YabP [Oscillospiraceae bacterium]